MSHHCFLVHLIAFPRPRETPIQKEWIGTGGEFQHRIVMNTWHGRNRPLTPMGCAGMRHLQIDFKDKLQAALNAVSDHEKTEEGFWLTDPTGIKILSTDQA